MGWFGKSFEDKVNEAVKAVNSMNLGVKRFHAAIEGKVVTLEGEAPSREVKAKIAEEFNKLVETENTINRLKLTPVEVAQAPPTGEAGSQKTAATPQAEEPASEPAGQEGDQFYVVKSGDTLGAIAKRYYGKASLYMKIFEANRDILDNPDLIKVGQRLRIPDGTPSV